MLKNVICSLFTLIILLIICEPIVYAEPIKIDEQSDYTKISARYDYLEDPDKLVTIHDLINDQHSLIHQFLPGNKVDPNFGYSSSAFWIHFTIENQSNKDEWLIELGNGSINYVEMYQVIDNKITEEWQLGTSMFFRDRPVQHRHFIFESTIPKHSTASYYLRVESKLTLASPITIWKPSVFYHQSMNNYILYGLYFGIVIGLAIYNLFLYFTLRRKVYLFYVAFVISVALIILSDIGLAHQYLWPSALWLTTHNIALSISTACLFFILFTTSFLNTRQSLPRFHKFCIFLAWYCFIAFLLVFIAPIEITLKMALLFPLTAPFFFIPAGILAWKNGVRHARFYVLAFAPLILGAMMLGLRVAGLTSDHFFALYGLLIGSAFEVILLSIALADQINTMRKETIQAQVDAYKSQKELLEKERLWNQSLEKIVTQRTHELETVLDNLKATQSKLVEQEKMASLGGLVAGVAHEINTPLGISVTAASYSMDNVQTLKELYEANRLKRKDLSNYITTMEETNNIILPNLMRASELVKSFKQIAVDQSFETFRNFKVKQYIGEVITSLQPTIKKTHLKVEVIGEDDLWLNSDPGTFSQVITNFIMNSIIHAYDGDKDGNIIISVEKKNDIFTLFYSDDGKGMDQDTLDKIFEPFFTTNRSQGGSGLGLHVIYNLITQKLNGTIDCYSNLGKGTEFVIKIKTDSVNFHQRGFSSSPTDI